jgi:hypothetical protein
MKQMALGFVWVMIDLLLPRNGMNGVTMKALPLRGG